MIIVFAGAGASKAVRSDRYPTTVEFFTSLPDDIKNDRLFVAAVDYLTAQNKKGHVIDIEQILWLLSELGTITDKASNNKSILGWFLEGNRLATVTGIHGNVTEFKNVASHAKSHIDDLSSRINAEVYRLYSELPEKGDLQNNWLLLIENLMKLTPHLELVTTNYDIVIEEAISTAGVRIQTGRTTGNQPILDQRVWDLSPPIWSHSYIGALTKLHGSVDWVRGNQPDRIHVGVPIFQGRHEKHVIIYPGFKGTPTDALFQKLHTYFQTKLQQAQIAIFIGYAFRDEYVNQILSRYLAESAPIIILNPSLPKVPFPKLRYKHIEKPFDAEGVTETVREVEKILKRAAV